MRKVKRKEESKKGKREEGYFEEWKSLYEYVVIMYVGLCLYKWCYSIWI